MDEPVEKPAQPAFLPKTAIFLALTLASASSDVLSYAKLGGVLTSAMTGNTALLGLALGEGKLSDALRATAALVGFCLGAAAASSLLLEARMIPRVLTIEAGMLAGFALLWFLIENHAAAAPLYSLILLSSVAMGMQSVAARRLDTPGINLDTPGINTVVFTTTLTAIIQASVQAIRRPNATLPAATRQQILALAAYLCGTTLAGVLIFFHVEAIVILPFAAVIMARGIMFFTVMPAG